MQQSGEDDRAAGVDGQGFEERHGGARTGGHLEDAATGLAERADQAAQLILVGQTRRHRHAAVTTMAQALRGGKADGAGLQRL